MSLRAWIRYWETLCLKRLRYPWLFAGLIPLVVAIATTTLPCRASGRTFTVADEIRLFHFGDSFFSQGDAIKFSPDEKYCLVRVEHGLIPENRLESRLLLYRTADVRRFLRHSEIASPPSPIWSVSKSTYKEGPIISHVVWLPDSSGFAFLAKTVSGNEQLDLADVRSRTVQTLTPSDQDVMGFDVRSHSRFVYTALSPAVRQAAVRESRETALVGTGRDLYGLIFSEAAYPFKSRWHDLAEVWAVVDGRRFRIAAKSPARPLAIYLEGERTLALSPDGRSLITILPLDTVPSDWETLYPPPYPSYPRRIRSGAQDLFAVDGRQFVGEYVLIDLLSGAIRRLTKAPTGTPTGYAGYLQPAWSADGQWVLLPATYLPVASRAGNQQSNRPCIAIINLRENDLSCLETLKGPKVGGGYEDGFHYITNVEFEPGGSNRVQVDYQLPNGSQSSTTYVRSSDQSWATAASPSPLPSVPRAVDITVKQSLNDSPVLIGADNSNGVSRVIWDPNPQLKEFDLGEASNFTWNDTNSHEWHGVLFKPPAYRSGRRYPLVIQTHGLYGNEFVPSGTYPTGFAARELAARGIVVLQVIASDGCPYSVDPQEGPCNVTGFEAAVAQLTADGVADPDRVGIIGFSRTCYYVLEALTTSSMKIRAASITDGVDEGYLQYVLDIGLEDGREQQETERIIGSPPFGPGLQKWIEASPGFNLQKISVPLQVVALGPVSMLGMWEPYALLRQLKKPVDLVMLTDQASHILTNPKQRLVSQGGVVDWFCFWLEDEEDPDASKAKQYLRWRGLREMQNKTE
jgi:dipeptidyl aminopeptidase/acylaminoacyl peptidase